MFSFRMPDISDVPTSPQEQKNYDVAPGVDYLTRAEMERIRQADAGAAMRQRALEGLPLMEGAATGRESAARAAANIAMSRANAQAAAQAAQGGPLAQRQALAAQAVRRVALAAQSSPAVAAEQQAAQKAYIAAAQGQRAQDIRRQVGLEEIAQREMQMGLQSKWDRAKALMEFEQEKIRKYGLDMGVWDAAAKLAQARTAATMGAIGAAGGSVLGYLGTLGSSNSGGLPVSDAAAAYGYGPNMVSGSTGTINPNFSV
jgi:hypothetical protein